MDGLNTQEVEYRKSNGMVNNTNIKYTRSIKTIIRSNILTLFNLINIVLAVLVITTGSLQNSLFVFVIVFNTAIAIVQEIKAKRIIDKLTLSNQELVTVIREGEKQEIKPNELVIDDIMYLKSGDDVLVDSVVIKSSACEVDESVITGESDAIVKKKNDKLISGTIIVGGSCYAKVTAIGSDNYASGLIKEASTAPDNTSYLKKNVNNILKIVTILIMPTGIMLFVSQYFFSGQTYAEAILSSVAGIVGMIPEGLVLLTSMALTVGVLKMAKKNVIVQRLNGIETLSCVDVLCLDKTGTITDGTMEVVKVVNLDKDNLDEVIANLLPDNPINATDTAMSKYFKQDKTYQKEKYLPFSSYRKYSAVSFKGLGTYAMGALEYLTHEDISAYRKYISRYIDDGYRIITICHSKYMMEKDLPNDIKVIGFVILKDNIRPNAKETLQYFKSQDVALKIISGDNPETVSNIMKRLNFDNYDKYMLGSSLPEEEGSLKEVIKNTTIFGRVTPKQKQLIIKTLKKDQTVGMIGDGVNDVLALKEANCGIALASGINAARSVSEVVLTTSDFGVLPSMVNEGRRVVNNIERVASLYLVKTIYSFLLSILCILLSHEYPFYPIQLSVIGAVCVGVPSFILALEPNYNKVTKGFLKKVFRNSLPSGLIVFLNIFLVIMLSYLFHIPYDDLRLLVVMATGLINLRLLYVISKPLTFIRTFLLVGCSLVFFELLLVFPNLLLVNKLNLISLLSIILFAIGDMAVLTCLEELYDKYILKKNTKEGCSNEKETN